MAQLRSSCRLHQRRAADNTNVQAIASNWHAGAVSTAFFPDAAVTQGATLYVWALDQWLPLATNSSAQNAPSFMSWKTTDAVTIRKLFSGDEDRITFAVLPNGASPNQGATLAAEYAEIKIIYTPGVQ